MPETKCGFTANTPEVASAALVRQGPTLFVDIGFDQNYKPDIPSKLPEPGIKQVHALIDTGASVSCIDNLLAASLKLPIVDRKEISGSAGKHATNIYLAQIHIPSLSFTFYGAFAGVDLVAGGQSHQALIGRDFLQRFTMVYEGKTGDVTLKS